jgi:chromosome segregation ATPase
LFNSKKKRAAAEAQRAAELKAQQAAELEAQQAAELQAQHAAELQAQQTAELQAQLDAALAERAVLEQRLAALDHGVGAIGEELVKLASAHGATNEHLRSIEDRVLAADVRVDAINLRLGDVEMLTADLDAINQRLASFADEPQPADAPLAQAPPPPPPPPPPTAPGADDMSERLAELRAQLDALTEATSAIDARVTGVSLELANQLTELGRDIDELNRRTTESAADGGATEIDTAELEARITERLDSAIDDVLDSTERLAAEQARYEIRFRADLADLAERIRRPST